MFEDSSGIGKRSYRSESDPELVRLCLENDQLAWQTLISRYRRLMYSIPWRYGFDPGDIKDVIQTVCIKLFKNLHALGNVTKLGWWLIRTTQRECRVLALKKKRYALYQAREGEDENHAADDDADEPADPSGTLEEMMLWTERHEVLHEILETLQPPCSLLINTLFFENGSYEDAAARLGVSPKGIGSRRARCFEKLHARLCERGITTAS